MHTQDGCDGQTRLFAYGTLQFPEVLALVIGRSLVGQPAELAGYSCRRIAGAVYPGLCPQPGERAAGVLYGGVTQADWAALDRFEGEEYNRRRVKVQTGQGCGVVAWVYVTAPSCLAFLMDEPWNLEEFRVKELSRFMAVCAGSSRDRSPGR